MTTKKKAEENRYQLVNNVAKRAKVLVTHDQYTAPPSNHNAIREAMQQEDDPRPSAPPVY